MTVRDQLFEHRRLRGCGHALELALAIIDEQQETIDRLTAQLPDPTGSAVNLGEPVMLIGQTQQANVTYEKGDGTAEPAPAGTTVAFASDNEAVATVDPASGLVTGVGAGIANIGATSTFPSGNAQTAGTAAATVTEPDPASSQVVLS